MDSTKPTDPINKKRLARRHAHRDASTSSRLPSHYSSLPPFKSFTDQPRDIAPSSTYFIDSPASRPPPIATQTPTMHGERLRTREPWAPASSSSTLHTRSLPPTPSMLHAAFPIDTREDGLGGATPRREREKTSSLPLPDIHERHIDRAAENSLVTRSRAHIEHPQRPPSRSTNGSAQRIICPIFSDGTFCFIVTSKTSGEDAAEALRGRIKNAMAHQRLASKP